ncbi:MAG: hypothetical protein WKG00_04645 [Polyangiaceae bacterium]
MTPNSLDDAFAFAVAASNGSADEAVIQIELGGQLVKEAVVPPAEVITIELPWVDALKHFGTASGEKASSLVLAGAFHLTSSVPITLYQFNPLDYTRLDRCTVGSLNPHRARAASHP